MRHTWGADFIGWAKKNGLTWSQLTSQDIERYRGETKLLPWAIDAELGMVELRWLAVTASHGRDDLVNPFE